MDFCEKMREERKKRGLSQKELGKKIGMSQQMIAQYENGNRNPKRETIEKIANALEVPTSELTGYNDTISVIDLFSGARGLCTDDMRTITRELYEIVVSEEDTKSKLLSSYNKLNEKGQEKAIEQVELLTKIEEYRKKE